MKNQSNHINQKNHSSDRKKAESLTSIAWGIALRNENSPPKGGNSLRLGRGKFATTLNRANLPPLGGLRGA